MAGSGSDAWGAPEFYLQSTIESEYKKNIGVGRPKFLAIQISKNSSLWEQAGISYRDGGRVTEI